MKTAWYIINLIRSVPALWMYAILPCKDEIRQDLKLEKNSWWEVHKALVDSKIFRRVFYYRTHIYARAITQLSKLMYRPESSLELNAETIGGGISIYHGHSSVIYAKTIGKNFSVYQQVTIGRGKKIDGNDIPIIGDNVTVYAGAIIVGGIKIGDNVVIGAGAVVTKNVPSFSTVVGAPIRILEGKQYNDNLSCYTSL